MKSFLLTLIAISVVFLSCRQNQATGSASKAVLADSSYGVLVADTIIYDVLLANHDSSIMWNTERLKYLDRELLVDNIFDMLYNGKASAYNFDTGEKITPQQLRTLENSDEFSRGKIDVIQFTEAWYINPGTSVITKKVLSMVLGSQVIDVDRQYIAKRAVFRVEMKE